MCIWGTVVCYISSNSVTAAITPTHTQHEVAFVLRHEMMDDRLWTADGSSAVLTTSSFTFIPIPTAESKACVDPWRLATDIVSFIIFTLRLAASVHFFIYISHSAQNVCCIDLKRLVCAPHPSNCMVHFVFCILQLLFLHSYVCGLVRTLYLHLTAVIFYIFVCGWSWGIWWHRIGSGMTAFLPTFTWQHWASLLHLCILNHYLVWLCYI